jgi:hypothetical protein
MKPIDNKDQLAMAEASACRCGFSEKLKEIEQICIAEGQSQRQIYEILFGCAYMHNEGCDNFISFYEALKRSTDGTQKGG